MDANRSDFRRAVVDPITGSVLMDLVLNLNPNMTIASGFNIKSERINPAPDSNP